MRMKRFLSTDMRQAIRQVREEMGPDAVILGSQRVSGGVEVTAAADYADEWPAERPAPVAARRPKRESQNRPSAKQTRATVAPRRRTPLPGAASASRRRSAATSAPHLGESPVGLNAVGEEIRALRGLLEHQLSGLATDELARRQPLRAAVLRQLTALGLERRLASDLAESIPNPSAIAGAWRNALAFLTERIVVTGDEVTSQGGIYALLGATGVGKTTTVAKLAARFALRYGAQQVGLITTDSYRVGAHEQLRTFGRIIGIPVHVTTSAEELRSALDRFYEKRLVLIDTAGMSQRDIRFSRQAALIHDGSARHGGRALKSLLVLSANTQMLGLDETVRAFQPTPERGVPARGGAGPKGVGNLSIATPHADHLNGGVASRIRRTGFDGCVVTKLDEATSLGALLSIIVRYGIAVTYTSDGQRVPEDIKPASAQALVSQAVALVRQTRQAQVAGGEPMAARG